MSGEGHNSIDLSAIRAKLAAKSGVQYWRSLEELAETPEFLDYLHREFPENATEWKDEKGRRNFLKLMGASLALAGLTSCSKPVEKIVPYVRQPEELVPGKPLYYATALTLCGLATGVLVESHMGRPTKIEGNPEHPASRGKSTAQMQAAILGLYDPDRSQVVTRGSRISTYSAFLAAVQTELGRQRLKRGAGLRFLTETVTSPTLAAQLRAILAEFPEARWHQWEPAGRHSARAGALLAFGEYAETRYDLSKADVILSLDADFLTAGPGALIHARQFAERRRVRHDHVEMNRLYAIESVPTATGTMADHRLAVRARDVEGIARALAQKIGAGGAAGTPAAAQAHAKWIDPAARDLQAHRGACAVVAGEEQPAVVHALAHAMNAALGSIGSTVFYTEPVEAQPADQVASLRELVTDMKAGRVEFLVMLGGNPVYNAPADFGFLEALRDRVPVRAHLSLYQDETSHMCQWHVPAAHELESWSDARALDGTVTIQQPLIAPLYGGKTAHELLAAFTQNPAQSGYDIVRNYWRGRREFAGSAADFERKWRRALHDGLVPGTEAAPKRVSARAVPAGDASNGAAGVEIVFRPDPCVHDGRFANLGWLQELPKPLTKLVWDNAALVSPRTAQQLGVRSEDVIEIQSEGRSVQAAVWVLPGMADDSLGLHLGYGRAHAGRVGSGVGVNTYAIRTATALWNAGGAKVQSTGRTHRLVPTQHHHSIEAPKQRVDILVREGTLEEYKRNPHFVREIAHEPSPALTLYPDFKYEGNAWGMAIDIGACNGCNACVVACQAENNIPVVGKDQVWRGREMHWIRIDRYYKGASLDAPDVVNQPVVCMHCESAPCEVVCPVAATVHSDEGLNDMIYNRCVGTRYCSNNCPYKVRRFNFLQYSKWNEPSLALLHNPDVTVRSRGVMEKCTYCVQRINVARIEAEKEGRAIRDGEIQTACQQACPSEAIVFGNINDKASRVAQLKAESLNYGMLTELNTKPRTTYLARLRNPNPDLSES